MLDVYSPTLKFCFTKEGMEEVYAKYRADRFFEQSEVLDNDDEEWCSNLYTKTLYGTAGAAAFDLLIPEDTTLTPGMVNKVDLGVAVDLSQGQAALLMPRSSNGKPEYLVGLSNTIGLIDHDFKGSICALFVTANANPVKLVKGTRFAQLMVIPFIRPRLENISKEEFYANVETTRCGAGFGTTGK